LDAEQAAVESKKMVSMAAAASMCELLLWPAQAVLVSACPSEHNRHTYHARSGMHHTR
jgi:hypothetical protein